MKKPTFIYYLNANSFYRKVPFLLKLLLFIALSVYILANNTTLINVVIASVILFFILITGFIKFNKKPFILLFIAISIFSLFWLLISKVNGEIIYYTFPWGTYITNKTFAMLFFSISRWTSIVLAGLLFMIVSSEQELIDSLSSIRVHKKIIMMISIAFNTVGFTIRDVDVVGNALESRNYDSKGIIRKLKRILYVGSTIFLSNLKKMDTLNQSYVLREKLSGCGGEINSIRIKINNISYPDESDIMKNFNVSVNRGEIISFFGHTGCGKTTLLKIISGIIPNVQEAKFNGEISLNNKGVSFEELRRHTILGFQEAEDQFILTRTLDEIFLELNDSEKEKALQLIKYFGVGDLLDKSLKDISTGQRKVISLIVTLSKERGIILLDEPTANLDEDYRDKLFKYLKKISKNKIIFIGTHDKNILKISKKVYLFNSKSLTWSKKNKKELANKLSNFNFLPDHKKSQNKIDLIKLENISYVYPDKTSALNNLSLSICGGDMVGIYGPNGCGKTTLIKLITGRIKPSSGKLNGGGKSIIFIEQEPQKQLFTGKVIDEIVFGDTDHSKKEINEILEITGLKKLKDEHPYFISRGQKQLLLISSVLIKKPRVVIIDEPFTGLDHDSIVKIVNLLILFNKRYNITIILTDQGNEILGKVINKQINLK